MDRLLCQPITMGGMVLKNRMVMPPMVVRYGTADGYITDRSIAYYEARARGGAGLIIQEGTYVHQRGRVLANGLGISDDKFIPGLSKLTQAVHRHDAKIAIQLVHGGGAAYVPGLSRLARAVYRRGAKMAKQLVHRSRPAYLPTYTTYIRRLALSPIGAMGRVVPRGMTRVEITKVTEYFAEAAVRAKRAGYDGVEVHAAHGYLVDQFISPVSNPRNDEYGGSIENRARFLVQIIAAIREATGYGFPVWCRINGKEFGVQGGETLEDAKEVARMAANAGAVAIHVSAYGPASPINLTTSVFTPAVIADLAAGIKAAVSVPVIAVGKMTPEAGEELLSEGKADLIAFGRALLADPELPNKVCEDRLGEIRPCIQCFRCDHDMLSNSAKGVGCSVNASMGKEALSRLPRP